jgi:hypothetical protein
VTRATTVRGFGIDIGGPESISNGIRVLDSGRENVFEGASKPQYNKRSMDTCH